MLLFAAAGPEGKTGALAAKYLVFAGPVGALSCSHWPSGAARGVGRCEIKKVAQCHENATWCCPNDVNIRCMASRIS